MCRHRIVRTSVGTSSGSDVCGHSVRKSGQSGQARLRERSITQWEKSRSIGSRKTAISGMAGLNACIRSRACGQ